MSICRNPEYFIEKNFFSETNLKCRQCLMETAVMGQDDVLLSEFDGEIVCETPNNLLNKFEGTLTWKNKAFSLDNDKIILRGCVLRNTQWCYGVVIFAGKDTKLMQNSGKSKFKRTSIDRLLNFLIIGVSSIQSKLPIIILFHVRR
jgi:magnesium-transporting ATPase (P-type)